MKGLFSQGLRWTHTGHPIMYNCRHLKETVRWAGETHQMQSVSQNGHVASHNSGKSVLGAAVGRKLAEAKQKRPTAQLAATLLAGAPPREARKKDKVGPTSTAHSSPEENQAEAGI